MSMDNLLSIVEQYKEAQQLADAAAAEIEALKAQLKTELAQRGTTAIEVGCHTVKLSDFSSTRLDSKAIKAAAPDLYAEYSKTVTGQRLLVS